MKIFLILLNLSIFGLIVVSPNFIISIATVIFLFFALNKVCSYKSLILRLTLPAMHSLLLLMAFTDGQLYDSMLAPVIILNLAIPILFIVGIYRYIKLSAPKKLI